MARYDLHAHTIASDGTLTPEQLVDLALERDVRVLAVTDHDTMDGILPCKEAAKGRALEIWDAVEISADEFSAEVHVLGYFLDPNDVGLQRKLDSLRQSRLDRGRKMVDRLNEMGFVISWHRVMEIAGEGSVGRPHIASALLEKGYINTIKEAFDRFIARGGPAYVDREKLSPTETIGIIKAAGGFASLAHPQYLLTDAAEGGHAVDIESYVEKMVSQGLEGIEIYYSDVPESLQRQLKELARRHDLIETGGTDFHGLPGQDRTLGDVWIPETTITRMREWSAPSTGR